MPLEWWSLFAALAGVLVGIAGVAAGITQAVYARRQLTFAKTQFDAELDKAHLFKQRVELEQQKAGEQIEGSGAPLHADRVFLTLDIRDITGLTVRTHRTEGLRIKPNLTISSIETVTCLAIFGPAEV